jgi:hypothetical protein
MVRAGLRLDGLPLDEQFPDRSGSEPRTVAATERLFEATPAIHARQATSPPEARRVFPQGWRNAPSAA